MELLPFTLAVLRLSETSFSVNLVLCCGTETVPLQSDSLPAQRCALNPLSGVGSLFAATKSSPFPVNVMFHRKKEAVREKWKEVPPPPTPNLRSMRGMSSLPLPLLFLLLQLMETGGKKGLGAGKLLLLPSSCLFFNRINVTIIKRPAHRSNKYKPEGCVQSNH